MEESNETYLSDWLANRITDEQLKQLVSEEDFLVFQNIKNALNKVEISSPDLEQHFNGIRQKIANRKKPKSKVIPLWRYASVAACLLVLFGVYHFFIAENTMSTDFGQTETITLADQSKVSLNSKSTLVYSNTYRFKRTLCLDGEAFFEVEKGSPFTVVTELGDIHVLGTKFNVIALKDFFEVKCYEGKVKVTRQEKSIVLTPGETARFYNGTTENWDAKTAPKPSWIAGESSFQNVPMRYVIDQFKNQYHVEVEYPANIEDIKFTGTFTNKEMTVALQTICVPLHLKFNKDNTGKIIISE